MSPKNPMRIKEVAGSFLSAAFGLAVLAIGFGIMQVIQDAGRISNLPMMIGLVMIFGSIFVVPVWIIFLVPLYLFVPRRSILWRWPVCTICGAVAGFLILHSVISYGSYGRLDFLDLCGTIVGGATCLFGSLTRRLFRTEVFLAKQEPKGQSPALTSSETQERYSSPADGTAEDL